MLCYFCGKKTGDLHICSRCQMRLEIQMRSFSDAEFLQIFPAIKKQSIQTIEQAPMQEDVLPALATRINTERYPVKVHTSRKKVFFAHGNQAIIAVLLVVLIVIGVVVIKLIDVSGTESRKKMHLHAPIFTEAPLNTDDLQDEPQENTEVYLPPVTENPTNIEPKEENTVAADYLLDASDKKTSFAPEAEMEPSASPDSVKIKTKANAIIILDEGQLQTRVIDETTSLSMGTMEAFSSKATSGPGGVQDTYWSSPTFSPESIKEISQPPHFYIVPCGGVQVYMEADFDSVVWADVQEGEKIMCIYRKPVHKKGTAWYQIQYKGKLGWLPTKQVVEPIIENNGLKP